MNQQGPASRRKNGVYVNVLKIKVLLSRVLYLSLLLNYLIFKL